MNLQATIKSVVEEDGQLSIAFRGWADADPVGTFSRPLGTINVPATANSRRAYYVGRRIFVEVLPV